MPGTSASVLLDPDFTFDAETPLLVIGAGAAGLVAALAAAEAGVAALVIERDPLPRGSTALSAGLIPAAGTRFQRARGIVDTPEAFAADIMAKASDAPDSGLVRLVTGEIGDAVEWLAERHGLPFDVLADFTYPGHRARRMHGLPSRSGGELMDRLRAAAEGAGIDILTSATAETLVTDGGGRVTGAILRRPDGARERVGARAVILACNGYGGNPDLVRRHLPEIAGATYFGHPGNRGDALVWGEALGLATRHLSGYQGHGSVAEPHGILITWATITEGGFQVNAAGRRFADESRGYSEAAAAVNAQEDGLAWTVFDSRIAAIARQFEDFRQAESQGAVLSADSPHSLAEAARLPAGAFANTCRDVDLMKQAGAKDPFGRRWAGVPALAPPFHAVRVKGALFHTQGGLAIDGEARPLRHDGRAMPNLFAAGGAACGVSGPTAAGYLSGNGLLTAVALGRIAGRAAAAEVQRGSTDSPIR
jgi:fumarate reductase flavoprotein subunit